MTDVQLRVTGGDPVGETAALWEWLRGERELTGRVRAVMNPPSEGELGGAVEALTVLLGSGGASMVLARSLTVWLQTRRSGVKVTVSNRAGDSVTVEATNLRLEDALPAITEVLSRDDA